MNFFEKEKKAGKTGFGEGVVATAEKNKNIVVLGADITASVGLSDFKVKFPERFISLGIAEQNMAGIAAGLSLSGKYPIFSTYAVFVALRAADQIRVSLCYNNTPCLIGGAHAGISVGPDGATHQALEDIAIMRTIPNLCVISPCDATQVACAVKAAVDMDRPVYIRFGRESLPNYSDCNQNFEIGKAQILKSGSDITIIANGSMVWEALQAAKILELNHISAEVINLHTIKPIDRQTIITSASKTGLVLCAEEHQIAGGVGSAVAEVVVTNCPVPMDFIGMKDTFGESGTPNELFAKYGMTSENITAKALLLLKKKKS